MTWKIGLARTCITPSTGVWLAGYGSRRAPTGKIHDLWTKTIAFEDRAGNRAVMITCDHMGIPKPMYEAIVAEAGKRCGLDRAQVMILYSHNHCGPVLKDDLYDYYPFDEEQLRLVDEYTRQVTAQMVGTIEAAMSDLRPRTLWMGEGRCGFAVNRRNNPEGEVQAKLDRGEPLRGPVDHSVPVLAIRGEGGAIEGILFGYACHTTTVRFTQWCGDYAGFAMEAIEQGRPGINAMFFNGCGADQNPLPRREVHFARRYGTMLAAAVEETLLRPMRQVAGDLRTAFEFVELGFDGKPTIEQLEQDAKAQPSVRQRWATRMLPRFKAGEAFPTGYPYPVQAWKLGAELTFIALGGEAVVDFASRFKRSFGAGTWISGYANVLVAYMPSRRVWEEGGYEGGAYLYEYGHAANRWDGHVEDRIAGTVERMVRSLT